MRGFCIVRSISQYEPQPDFPNRDTAILLHNVTTVFETKCLTCYQFLAQPKLYLRSSRRYQLIRVPKSIVGQLTGGPPDASVSK